MNYDEVNSIIKNKRKTDVFYNNNPVWIQDVNKDIARVGFIYENVEKDVYIKDLYEKNLD